MSRLMAFMKSLKRTTIGFFTKLWNFLIAIPVLGILFRLIGWIFRKIGGGIAWIGKGKDFPDEEMYHRSRLIFSTLIVVFLGTGVSFGSSILVFHDEWTLKSFFTLEFFVLIEVTVAWIFWKFGLINVAGGILVIGLGICQLLIMWFGNSIAGALTALIFLVLGYWALPSWMTILLAFALLVANAVMFGNGTFQISMEDYTPDQLVSLIAICGLSLVLYLNSFKNQANRRALRLIEAGVREKELVNRAAKAEVEAAEARAQLADEASKAKSQFLANMSHELRTPLNAIIGYIEIMLGGMVGSFTDKQTELQTHVWNNAKRLLGLINDILDLAKIESGTLPLLITVDNPRKIIQGIVDNMQSLATKKNIWLKATFSDDFPEIMHIDVKKLQQILTNLIGNSLKFTDQGGVTVDVSLLDQYEWQIKVTDTGIGMPQDAASYIFDVFKQVDGSDTRAHQGTGLGLAITKSLIDRLGGTVVVQSELGKGSVFIVTFPRVLSDKKKEDEKKDIEPQTATTTTS